MKWIKRLLLAAAVLLLLLIVGSAISYRYARQVPDFYKLYEWDNAQRSIVNQRTVDKLTLTRGLAASTYYADVRALHGNPETLPAAKPLTVRFSEEELNAFISQNLDMDQRAKSKLQQFVTRPAVFFRDGQIIVAGEVKELGLLASLHFELKLNEQGQLDARWVKTMAGRLPVPRAVLAKPVEKIRLAATAKLPQLRRSARQFPAGAANTDTVALAAAKLLINALDGRASPPILYVPVDEKAGEKGRFVPLHIRGLRVEGDELVLTVDPMTAEGRAKVFEELRN